MSSDEPEPTIAEDSVVTKYVTAGEIVNRVLKQIADKCIAGALVIELCEEGDRLISDETGKIFKRESKKGIAFPTCVSVNNCICHFSPLRSDPPISLVDGDVVKIDLGAHIDGFIAVAAHTVVVGASLDNKVTGRKADAIIAAHEAADIALRLVRPKGENYAVTEAIQKVAESFKCKPVSGMLSHQLKRDKIDGEKSIIQNPSEAQRKEHQKCEFDVHEVYAIDVLISTGEGKGREVDSKTTVFKRTDEGYHLKLKASRTFFSTVDKTFRTMPFTLRAIEDEKTARLGVKECINHKLLDPFTVLYEKDDEIVAQFKFTVLLLPNGPRKITGLPFEEDLYQTEHKIEDEAILMLKKMSVSNKTKKKKKSSKAKTDGDSKTEEGDANKSPEA